MLDTRFSDNIMPIRNTYKPDHDQMDHDEAVLRFRDGSAEAFKFLHSIYSDKIYRFCLRMMGDKEQASDAYQDTFIKVYENSGTFRTENFSSWIYTIARRTCLNHIRAIKNHADFDEALTVVDKTKQKDYMLKKSIDDAINQLSLGLKEAFLLREYQECSYQDIADILDIDLSSAKVRVHRARQKLRVLLEPVIREYDEY
ncbi:MAG: sigma-70 family RNA polymerase sigma factor [Candidatus Kapaibacteriales bacterium]